MLAVSTLEPLGTKVRVGVQSFDTSGETFWQIFSQPNGRTGAIISQNVSGAWRSTCSLGLLAWFPC